MTITSVHNPRIQRVRSLLSDRNGCGNDEFFVLEGVRLVEEIFSNDIFPDFVFVSINGNERIHKASLRFRNAGIDVEEISPELMKLISATKNPQGILAVLPIFTLPIKPNPDFLLIIDQIRDPGNLGTLIRTASAAGVDAVFITHGSAEPFSPKVVRSAMGAHFHIPIRHFEWKLTINTIQQLNPRIKFIITDSDSGVPLWNVDLTVPITLVIGGEAEGVSDEAACSIENRLSIPMPGGFESLNAAVASGIFLFEVIRQRSQ